MPNEQPSFQRDIRPLFRDSDRRTMTFRFDLWHYDDVRSHASVIARRLEAGDMPCDERWPADRVALFRAWMEGDFQP